jgi:hypothetical protein
MLVGRYESYFADFWSSFPAVLPGRLTYQPPKLNYRLFKLFHLSILWRASVSMLADFTKVDLGPHEETLRRMILDDDPGPVSKYRLAAQVILRPNSREVHRGVIAVPEKLRYEGGWYYSSIYAGCVWHCFVSANICSPFDLLTDDGIFSMLVLDIRDIPNVWSSLKRAGGAPRKQPRI